MRPLNGILTHPLSPYAVTILRGIARAPLPRSGLNPGVADRLLREGLVSIVQLPSPFKTHNGRDCDHLEITAEGRAVLTDEN